MDGESRVLSRVQHTLPILLTLVSFLALWYRSTNRILFHRYSLTFFCLYTILIVATVQTWRFAIRERGWRAFLHRIATFQTLQCIVIVACALFLIDLVSDPLEIATSAMRGKIPALGYFAITVVFFALVLLFSADPHKVLGRIGVLLISTCISVVVVEAVFRWFILAPRVPQAETQFQRLVASTWPEPIASAKPPGTYRVLGLADSFGQAGGARNYHYLLAHALNGPSPRYEVINLSVPEYEPSDELALLRRFGPRFVPNLVLEGFTVGNDFYSPIEPLLRFRDISIRAPIGYRSLRPKNFAMRSWWRRFMVFKRDADKKKVEEEHGSESGSFSREEFLRIERDRLEICNLDKPEDPLLGVTKVLDGIRDQVLEMNAEHVLVIHPDQYQVETGLFREICDWYHLCPERYDLRRPQRLLIDYCHKRGIDYIDLLPAFRKQGAGGGLYLFRDTHYNDKGNQLAASEIAKFLNRRFFKRGQAVKPAAF